MMTYLIPALIVLVTVISMEMVAWLAHKYLMHGFLWIWHEDHHQPDLEGDKFFQKMIYFFWFLPFPVQHLISSV